MNYKDFGGNLPQFSQSNARVRQALPSHYQGRGARRAGWGLIRCEQHRLKFPKIHLNKNSIILQFVTKRRVSATNLVIKKFHNHPAPSLS